MKARNVIAVVALGGWIGLGAGCGQKEESTPPAQTAPAPAPKAASEAPKQVEAQKPAASPESAEMEKRTMDAIGAATAPAGTEAQGLLDKAKSLIAMQDYKGASALIQELSKLKLTPEQQKLYDDLKAQVQKALAASAASDATKAAGDLMGGSK